MDNNLSSSMFNLLKQEFPNTPNYVLMEFLHVQILDKKENLDMITTYYNDNPIPMIGKWYRSYLNGPWRLTTINVNPEDFDDFTVNAFIERDFGNINAYMVPKDRERMMYQTKIATGNGDNEPVILVMDKSTKKYQIVEGWHRTMAILKIGDNGEDLKNWNKVKLRAYITTM